MSTPRAALILSGTLLALPLPALAHGWGAARAGSSVSVAVALDGREAPLYPAPDRSGRFYVEAREGSCYDVRLTNRTGERLGVVLIVDGLNAISGERGSVGSPTNRMYVLGPWDETSVRGWRTSLSEVRRFTFVDERSSYAARSGKANGKLGWIEVGVFRERARPRPWWSEPWLERDEEAREDPARDGAHGAPAPRGTQPEASDRAAPKSREGVVGGELGGRAQSYPGTGWGGSTYDPAEVVQFAPETRAAEVVTLRYEYASTLRALGVLPAPYRDRLSERESGQFGFVQPPRF
jgi:hypothetical protein